MHGHQSRRAIHGGKRGRGGGATATNGSTTTDGSIATITPGDGSGRLDASGVHVMVGRLTFPLYRAGLRITPLVALPPPPRTLIISNQIPKPHLYLSPRRIRRPTTGRSNRSSSRSNTLTSTEESNPKTGRRSQAYEAHLSRVSLFSGCGFLLRFGAVPYGFAEPHRTE